MPTETKAFREIAPRVRPVEHIAIQPHAEAELDNGVQVYALNGGEQHIFSLDLVFPAGRWFHERAEIPVYLAKLLRGGTESMDARALEELIDSLGLTFSASCGRHFLTLSMQGLTKQLPEALGILREIWVESTLPETELELVQRTSIQRLKVKEEKVEHHADKATFAALYGAKHPYGVTLEEADILAVKRSELQAFRDASLQPGKAKVFLAGKLPEDWLQMLSSTLGAVLWSKPSREEPIWTIEPSRPLRQHIAKPGALQSAIRVAQVWVPRQHPDAHGLGILTTILGGYFGARLMSNLREDKGFTYGVYSSIGFLPQTGYFEIATEVGVEHRDAALHEIYHEMRRLRQEKVPADELELVANYVSGSMLRRTDGVLPQMRVIKSLVLDGLDYEYLATFMDTVKTITPDKILQLAQRYLHDEAMIEIAAG